MENLKRGGRQWNNFTDNEGSVIDNDDASMLIGLENSNGKDYKG